MRYVVVDVETDGPCPGLYSMLSVGAVMIGNGGNLQNTFYAEFRPISDMYQPEALKVNRMTREQTLEFPDPLVSITNFKAWLDEACGPEKKMFVSDNNGFDWQFVNYYFWKYLDNNPFGHSSTNMGSLYKGMVRDAFQNFKFLRKTKHTHNALDDAMGNAEALLAMSAMGMKLGLK